MKKTCFFIFAVFMAAALCACGEKQELIDMSTIENSDYTAIVWEDRTYVPFCVVSKSDCGAQIGYVNGDTDDRVCEYGDYPVAEWIANYITVDGGAMLYKEINVTDITDGLQSEYDWNDYAPREKTNKEQKIKGNQAWRNPRLSGSLVTYQCGDGIEAKVYGRKKRRE